MSGRKKILAYSVKITVGLLCAFIIYSKIRFNAGSGELVTQALHNSTSLMLIVLSCCLVPFNWGIESYKWRFITSSVQAISFGKAFQSVLAGVCVGNLAPGRSTEFVGKIMFFDPENRAMATLLHFVNGLFQLLVTISIGILGLLISFSAAGSGRLAWAVFALSLLLLALFILVIARFGWLQQKLFSIKWLQRYKPAHTVQLSKRHIVLLLSASLIRYATFTLQFYLLLLCFGIHAGVAHLLPGIAVYFMLTSVVPMISVAEPAIRAAIALFVFSGGSSDAYALQLVAVSTMLWLINIVLPSIAGYIVILKEKFIIKNMTR